MFLSKEIFHDLLKDEDWGMEEKDTRMKVKNGGSRPEDGTIIS